MDADPTTQGLPNEAKNKEASPTLVQLAHEINFYIIQLAYGINLYVFQSDEPPLQSVFPIERTSL